MRIRLYSVTWPGEQTPRTHGVPNLSIFPLSIRPPAEPPRQSQQGFVCPSSHGLRTRRVRSASKAHAVLYRETPTTQRARESPKHSLRGLDLPIIALVEKPATQLILGLNRNNHCGASIFRQHSRTEDPPDPHQRASHTCGLEQRYRSAAHIWSHRNNHNGASSALVSHGLRTRRVRISEQVKRGALRRDANNAARTGVS